MIKHKFAYEPHNLFYFNQEFFHYPINGKPSIYHFFPNIEKFLFNKRVLDVGAGLGHLKKADSVLGVETGPCDHRRVPE